MRRPLIVVLAAGAAFLVGRATTAPVVEAQRPTVTPANTQCVSCTEARKAYRIETASATTPQKAGCNNDTRGLIVMHTAFGGPQTPYPNGDVVRLWICAQSGPKTAPTSSWYLFDPVRKAIDSDFIVAQ